MYEIFPSFFMALTLYCNSIDSASCAEFSPQSHCFSVKLRNGIKWRMHWKTRSPPIGWARQNSRVAWHATTKQLFSVAYRFGASYTARNNVPSETARQSQQDAVGALINAKGHKGQRQLNCPPFALVFVNWAQFSASNFIEGVTKHCD